MVVVGACFTLWMEFVALSYFYSNVICVYILRELSISLNNLFIHLLQCILDHCMPFK